MRSADGVARGGVVDAAVDVEASKDVAQQHRVFARELHRHHVHARARHGRRRRGGRFRVVAHAAGHIRLLGLQRVVPVAIAVLPAVLEALQVRADREARVGAQIEPHHAVGGQERRRRVEPSAGLAVGEEGDLLVDFAASARRIYDVRANRSVDGEGRCAQHDAQQQLPPPRQAHEDDAKHHRRKPEICERINPERCEWTGPPAEAAVKAAAGVEPKSISTNLVALLGRPREQFGRRAPCNDAMSSRATSARATCSSTSARSARRRRGAAAGE